MPAFLLRCLGDNALDATDAEGRPGAVEITTDDNDNLIVADQGIGTPSHLADLFCVARPMLSRKLLRRTTRGCVGNGLRVALGYLTATRGRLIIETAATRVELAPELDGTSRVVSSTAIASGEAA